MQTFVRDLMTVPTVTVRNDATVADATDVLLREASGEIFVIDDTGRLLGSVPDYELLKAQLTRTTGQTLIQDVMSRHISPVGPQMPAEELAARFRDGRHSRAPVVENGRLVGQIDRRDVMRLLIALDHLEADPEAEQDAPRCRLEETATRGPQFLQCHSSQSERVGER